MRFYRGCLCNCGNEDGGSCGERCVGQHQGIHILFDGEKNELVRNIRGVVAYLCMKIVSVWRGEGQGFNLKLSDRALSICSSKMPKFWSLSLDKLLLVVGENFVSYRVLVKYK